MTEICFHVSNPPTASTSDLIHVVLYDGNAHTGAPRVGGPVKNQVRRLGTQLGVQAFDLLTVALAVTAADTFVNRHTHSDVGWQREMTLRIPLAEPDPWRPVLPLLQDALDFLTGDRWEINAEAGGVPPPSPMGRRSTLVQFADADRVCLFSGGLDSAIGVLDLLEARCTPLLVSHAYRLDKGKQERLQRSAFGHLPRFAMLANPTCGKGMHPDPNGNDITMRGRSFNFLAAGGAAGSLLAAHRGGRVPLLVPENGFIAVNAPLTSRRMGSLSTRTTHHHFLQLMQQVFDALSIPADIVNPYEFKAKGEMLTDCLTHSRAIVLAADTVSCGKWKRKGVQCGRCVPCLVRRASFHAAGVTDPTTPDYTNPDLVDILRSEHRADILALGRACQWTAEQLSAAVGASGPLPTDPDLRTEYERVVSQGLREVRAYLASCNVVV